MIGFLITRDGKFLSPHGYVVRPENAQVFRSREDAQAAIGQLGRVALGGEVIEKRIPDAGVGHDVAEVEYDPWGLGR